MGVAGMTACYSGVAADESRSLVVQRPLLLEPRDHPRRSSRTPLDE